MKNLREFYIRTKVFKLVRHKGVYSYEHVDCWKKFGESKLPIKITFCTKLNKKDIIDQNYEYAHQV